MLADHLLNDLLKSNAADFADVFFESTQTHSVYLDDNRIEDVSEDVVQGTSLRLIHDLKTWTAQTNQNDEQSLKKLKNQLKNSFLADSSPKNIQIKTQATNQSLPVQKAPQNLGLDAKIKLLQGINARARSLDKRVAQVSVSLSHQHRLIQIANSEGHHVCETQNYLLLLLDVTTTDGDRLQPFADSISGLAGLELLSDEAIENLTTSVVQKSLQALTAPSFAGGTMPVVLSSLAGGTLVHEAVGHGLEADLVHEGLSVYRDKLGESVASSKITLVDDATLAQHKGSFAIDDEGTPAQRTVLIENGVLKNYLCDRLTHMKTGWPLTGNGRRESYEYRPIPRMTNTFVLPGQDDPDAILRSVDKGLLVKGMGGGQVNTTNGDFMFECTEAYVIENGAPCHPVRNVSLIGNGPQVLQAIDAVGTDLGFDDGICGKEGQSVPVTDGIPTMKVPEMVVGGTAS